MRVRRLRRPELPIDCVEMAQYLIGKTLVHDVAEGRLAGRIVETEAYLPDDPACHAFNGPTRRNQIMFQRHGHAYVYFCYGMHYMMNVTAGVPDVGSAVLLRALEPLEGIEDSATGPGRLAAAMEITPVQYGLDLCGKG